MKGELKAQKLKCKSLEEANEVLKDSAEKIG
jgi:hypothetical protein